MAFDSNRAGGTLGGITNGEPLVVRFAVKPTSSLTHPQPTVTVEGEETTAVTKGRHDPCVGIRAVPVGEAMMGLRPRRPLAALSRAAGKVGAANFKIPPPLQRGRSAREAGPGGGGAAPAAHRRKTVRSATGNTPIDRAARRHFSRCSGGRIIVHRCGGAPSIFSVQLFLFAIRRPHPPGGGISAGPGCPSHCPAGRRPGAGRRRGCAGGRWRGTSLPGRAGR